jgi:hypothetical protein
MEFFCSVISTMVPTQRMISPLAVFGANAEFVVQPALAVFEKHVQRRAKPVAVVRMQARQPVAGSAMHGAGRKAELGGDIRNGDDPVARHVPVPDGVSGAGQRQRLALEIGKQPLAIGAAGKGVLHHREADQKHDQNETASKRRLDDVVGKLAGDCQPGAEQPDEDQQPGRHQEDGAVVAVEAKIGDQQDTGRAGQREGEAGDTRRDGRIIDGDAEQETKTQNPGERRIAQMLVPAVEIEVGEQEDHQARGEEHFGARPPYALVAGGDRDQLRQEAEIDADIGKHGPGERRRCGQHRGSLDDEQDGQEHRQQAGNAKHDAAIKCESVNRVLVGVGLPEIDLRQVGASKFRHEGDDRAGVERDAEHIRLVARLAVKRKAFARRDRQDALRAQVRPEQF